MYYSNCVSFFSFHLSDRHYPCTLCVDFGRFIKSRLPYIGALAGTTLFSTIYLLAGFDIHIRGAEKMLRSVPFAGYELWWVVPSIIGFALFLLWDKLKTKQY
ncbi:branched-chain amino acid transport system II carrier protein [Sphingobacterium sp. KU25419]|nr:branched-chain amino acid transport system II carrier protein [Sphingobacterium sp. KU25419]